MIKYNLTEFPDDQDGECPLDPVNTGRTHVRFHSGKSIWASRSTLEKVLAVLCLVLLAIVVLLVVLMAKQDQNIMYLHLGHDMAHDHKDVCLSRACVDVAASILSAADFTADPCQDFYQYACGGWVKANPIPHGQSTWGTFGKLWQQNQLVIKNVLESPPEELANDAERKAQTYYRSCVDSNGTAEARGGTPLLELIERIGGWNLTGSNWSAGSWDFQRTLQRLHNEFNAGPLFTWSVVEDDKNSSSYVIQVDQGRLTLPSRDYYINKTTADDHVLAAYLDYITKVAVLLGGNEEEVRRQANDVIRLETELAEIITPSDERRDEEAIYHKMTIAELQETAPLVDWFVFFQDAFSQVNVTLPHNLQVVVYAPEYLSKLCDLLKEKYLSTLRGKVILNNYMMSKSGGGLVRCLSKAFRDAYKMLRKALVGTDEDEETWHYCVDDTNAVLGFASGAMFVRQNFKSASKQLAEEMIEDVRTAFIENTKKLHWMDEETRRKAEDKAEAITKMMGFPPEILDSDYLNDKYALLEVKENEYFENNIRFSKFALIKNLMKYGQPVNKTRWDMTPPSVNAYYSASHNMIVFPAGILQAPFYDPQYPRSLNFGAMGVVMGHELTHAFDDQGREYDKYGNMNQWWNNATINRFKERTKCMVEQYSQYKIGNLTVNGRQTLGENIADNGGLKASFDAYRLYRKAHGEEVPLPGVNLTHSQLFFLSFSQVWCSAATPEAERVTALNDGHAPARYRVIGTLSNSEDFAREYRCPLGSNMNPNSKCQVW
ncbi:endothelin-converting enzyme homolog [Amphibalanus amphitrite]|uniref:endothelin-converting enzyme homolog n=1 Tax=Amphibalanus amphitrite TaxID=1232801 RepID=UPI001C90EB9F|nr:endothelin-converting enzyme homolog [Amphibalanus amphitrite]